MSNVATIPVSYTELARQGVHALRGIGYSFAVAERAAHTLAATEAATGLGLKCLQVSADRIQATMAVSIRATAVASGVTLVDAGGKSLLELSPFLLDVACGDAQRLGQAAVLAENVDGMPYIADLALRAANRKLRIWVTYSGGWESFAAAPASFLINDHNITGGRLTDPRHAWQKAAQRLNDTSLSLIAPALAAPMNESSGRVLIVAQTGNGTPELLKQESITVAANWQAADRWKAAFDMAMNGQIDAEMPGFNFFYTCVRRIWAPTSDRSRAQQG